MGHCPSSSGNTRPWRIVREEGAPVYHFFLTKVKRSYYDADMHNVDIGIAMSHFELAARQDGLDGVWKLDDPDLPSIPAGTGYRTSWAGR